MKKRLWIGAMAPAAVGLALLCHALAGRASEPAPVGSEGGRGPVELTIYAQDFALVHETRPAQLQAGANRLTLSDVSKALDPQSVLLRCTGGGQNGKPEITGHSYDLGLTSSQGLLKQKVGQEVELVRYDQQGREASREHGRLLVAQDGSPAVVEVDGKLYVNPQGTLVVARDEGASVIPQLAVQVESPAAGPASVDLAYLTRGLRWSADYVATLSGASDDRLDLECYATVTNRTGARYPNAAVTLVAGAPSRAVRAAGARVAGAEFDWSATYADAGVRARQPARLRVLAPRAEWEAVGAPENVAEFHTYPLKQKATIYNEQLNRLLMLRREGVKVHKDYSYRTPCLGAYHSPQEERGSVAVAFSFVNNEREGIGAPIPAGAIRVYDPGRSGRLRYAGAADVPPTPRNKKVSVTLANAFDVTAEYRTVGSKRLGKHKMRKQVEVVLRNERGGAVAVRAVQAFYNGWRITTESAPHLKLDSNTAQWTLQVPAGGKKTLAFTVELSC